LEQLLTKLAIPRDVKDYPDTGHSFLNNPDQWWFKALKVVDTGYHEVSAEDARRRITSFFRQQLSS
jgi:carboxymethylenebutenolidase